MTEGAFGLAEGVFEGAPGGWGTGRRCVDGREVLRCAQNDRGAARMTEGAFGIGKRVYRSTWGMLMMANQYPGHCLISTLNAPSRHYEPPPLRVTLCPLPVTLSEVEGSG